MARKRRKRTKRLYITQVHEDAIIAYNNSSDPRERTLLYATYIQPAFNEMVDKIVFTYKFTTLPNIDDLREECKIYLTTILNKREVDLDDLGVEHQLQYASVTMKYEEQRQEQEFWTLLWEEIEGWEKLKLKANEEKVLQAVKILLEDRDNPNLIFNKKAIYLYIREITGLNTKQVVNNLNKLRIKYRIFRHPWDEGKF